MANVLLVDDRPENLLALEAILEPLGQTLLTANSGEDALRQLLRHDVAVILLDVQMPIMDGFEVAGQIKRREKTRHIPIIMISGNEQATEEFYVHRIGADDFMKKPFSRAEVFARIERLLDENRVPRRIQQAVD